MVDSDWRNGRAGKPFADWLIRSPKRSKGVESKRTRTDRASPNLDQQPCLQ